MNLEELVNYEVGEIIDLMIESSNDSAEYPLKATQTEIDSLFT